MLLKTAWKNIWRNKRRTLITASSVFFAVFFSLLMRSVQLGSLYKMVNDIVGTYTGAIQIHQEAYWNDKSVNHSFRRDKKMESKLSQIPNVRTVVPRFESFALASRGDKTKGAMIIGIDPQKEDAFTHLSEKIKQGKYLNNSSGVLIGDELAHYLNLSLGDTLVLLSQAYHGLTAAGKYPVVGIFHFASLKINRRMIYMPLPEAQKLYACENRLTGLVLNLKDKLQLAKTKALVKSEIDNQKYEILTWKKILPEFVQLIKTKQASSKIVIFLLYMIVGFGVLGTIVMMTGERMREFGVLIALGMAKGNLIKLVSLETLFLSILGLIFGSLASLPIINFYHIHPILMSGAAAQSAIKNGIEPVIVFAMQADIFFNQLIYVLAIVVFSLIFPIVKIARLQPVKAMRK